MGKYIPALNEVLEILSPLNPSTMLIHLVLQLRYRLPDDVRQEVDEACPWLHLTAIGGEREAMLCHLEQGNAQAPYVGGDGI